MRKVDNKLRQVGDNMWKCLTCGAFLSSGIVTLSNHWASCTGKGYMKELIELKEEDNLNMDTLRDLTKRHKDILKK